jgi:import inner membrane translocase subunit TIM23
MSDRSNEEFNDEGLNRPIPSFDTSSIRLSTIAPAYGVPDSSTPDYLDYDTDKGRGIMVTMFANAGLSYLIGTFAGGLYGLNQGLKNTPSDKFKVKLNSVLNKSSRHGSRIGNMAGCLSVFYSVYEYVADQVSSARTLHWTIKHCKLQVVDCTSYNHKLNNHTPRLCNLIFHLLISNFQHRNPNL